MSKLCNAALAAGLIALWLASAAIAQPPPPPFCVCNQFPAYTFRAGNNDNYAPPNDPASRGAALTAAYPSSPWKNFDSATQDAHLGQTFAQLPGNIVCAELEIHLRPTSGGATNDKLYLGLPPAQFAWGIQLSELLGGAWTPPINPGPFTLDLDNLPATLSSPATSLIANLNADRRLDFLVQDDTQVDYAKLTLHVDPEAVRTVGNPDGFVSPTETTNIGPELSTAFPNAMWKDLDDATSNRFIGQTFGSLSGNVVQASLEAELQPHSDFPENDTLYLGLNPDVQFSFESRFFDLPEAGGTWTNNAPTNFQLDLGALPGAVDLLPKINTDDRLDLLIQDNTKGDYLRLRYRTCPPPLRFGGGSFEAVNGATLGPVDAGFTVSTSGAGNQGVRVPIGSGDGFCVGLLACLGGIGTALDLAVAGTVQQINQPFNASATLSFLNTGPDVEMSVAFPSPFDIFLKVEVWNQNILVASYLNLPQGPQGVINGVVASLPTTACIRELDYIATQCFRTLLVAPVAIQVEQGGPVVTGDEIRICRDIIVGTGFKVQSVALTTPNATAFAIEGAAFHAFGFFERGLGYPGMVAGSGGLTVYDLSPTGEEGVAVVLDSVDSVSVSLSPIDFGGTAPIGAFLEAEAFGELGGVGGQALGTLRVTRQETAFEVSADFTNISSPTQRIQVLNNGQVLLDLPGHSGIAARVSNWPKDLGKLGGQTECYVTEFPPGTIVEVGGTPYQGDELRILAETGVTVGSKSELRLRAAGLTEFTLTGVEAMPPLLFSDGFESGDTSAWTITQPSLSSQSP